MIIELDKNQRTMLKPFFYNMEDTIIHTCLQGYMGRAWTDSKTKPSFALLLVGDFCYIGGTANLLLEQALNQLPQLIRGEIILLVPVNDNIEELVCRNHPNWNQVVRYAFRQDREAFNLSFLKQVVSILPIEYEITPIDDYWYHKALSEDWSKDLVSNFTSSSDYLNRGIGVVISCNGEIISGASSYTIYDCGIEIQVDTKPTHRKKGLAFIASASLIIACRERNIYPSWDAATEISVQLAKKLGYIYSHSYHTYVVTKV